MIRNLALVLACAGTALMPLAAHAAGTAPSSASQLQASRSAPLAAAPTAPTASLLTSTRGSYTDPRTQLALQWSPVSTSVRGYRFGYSTTDARETDPRWTSSVHPVASAGRPFVFTTLVSGATYKVYVEAVYSSGAVRRTTLTGTTQSAAPPQTATPGALPPPTISNLAPTTMTVNWQPPSQPGSSAVDGYQVGWGTWDSAMLPGTARSMNLSGFTAGATYTIRVRAHNASGYGTWISTTTTTRTTPVTPVPQTPGALATPTVTNLAPTMMTVNWQPPSQPGSSAVDGYQVGWGTWDSVMLPGTARSMNLSGFTAGTTYTIRVRAHNASGYGTWSQVTASTPAGTPAPAPTPQPGTFQWSGGQWSHSQGGAGAGTTYWSAATSARLFTKADGSAISGGSVVGDLRARVEPAGGNKYNGSQIISAKKDFGYGNYEVGVRSRLDQYPAKVVVGMFLYKGSPLREIDMEPSKWGGTTGRNMSYQVHGPDGQYNRVGWNTGNHWDIDNRTPTRHRFTWKPRTGGGSTIDWVVLNADGSAVPNSKLTFNWDQTPVSGMQFMLELWATAEGSTGHFTSTQSIDYAYFHHWALGAQQPALPSGFSS